jgi:hypothetical protein
LRRQRCSGTWLFGGGGAIPGTGNLIKGGLLKAPERGERAQPAPGFAAE